MKLARRWRKPWRVSACDYTDMTVEIKLFGFGDERPAIFGGGNRLCLDIATPATPRALLHAAGIDEEVGLVLMSRDSVIPPQEWDEAIIEDSQSLTLLSAFEGG